MTTAAIREKLQGYIKIADDQQIKAIYQIVEEQMASAGDWSEDEECMAELNERVKRWEDGIDPSFSLEEVKAELELLDRERSKSAIK